jgi:hypothetical protein
MEPTMISSTERNILDGLTATTAELNTLDGILATVAELNRAADASTRIVAAAGATLAVTEALHDGKIITLDKADGMTVTLPAATGSGAVFTFVAGILMTADCVIQVNGTPGTDIMTGHSFLATATETTGVLFATAADSDTITLNGSTSGGLKGNVVRVVDIASGLYWVEAVGAASGAEVTPFSAAVA